MAESMHVIITQKTFVVNHQGNDLTTDISNFFDGIDKLTDLDEIKTWLETKTPEEQLGFYHHGFDSSIIKNRAACRPTLKTYAKIEDFSKAVNELDNLEDYHIHEGRQTITKNILVDEKAKDRAAAWKPKPKLVPGSSTPKAFGKGEESALKMAIESLQAASIDDTTIVDILGAKFDKAKVIAVIEGLKE